MWYRFFSMLIVFFFLIYWFRRTRLFVLLVLKTSSTERKEDEIRGRPAAHSKTTAWIRNTRKETRSCYKNETCERFVSSVDISCTLLLFRVVTRGAGYVHGSRVLKAEMWRWERWRSLIESHPLPTLESDLLCARGRQVGPKHTFPMMQSSWGEGGSAVHSLSSNQKCSFSNGKYYKLSRWQREGGREASIDL